MRSKHNLVLVFVPDGPQGDDYLERLAGLSGDILGHQARIMAVVSGSASSPRHKPPFTLLLDEGGTATRRLLGDGAVAGLCVADRYGVIYFVESTPSLAGLPDPSVILEWLEFVEFQCPE